MEVADDGARPPADLFPAPSLVAGPSIAAGVVRRIQGMILNGELQGGAHLGREGIAEAFGVSATPVREAFTTLASEGWVTPRRHRGVVVNPITRARIVEHCDLTEVLGEYLIRRAIERRTPEQEAELRAAAAEVRSLDDSVALGTTFRRLASLIYDMAEAPRARELFSVTARIIPEDIVHTIPDVSVWAREASALAESVADGDTERAVHHHRFRLRAFRDRLLTWLEERGVLTPVEADGAAAAERAATRGPD